MAERNDVVANLRASLKGAHEWLEGAMQGVTDAGDVVVMNQEAYCAKSSCRFS